MTNYRQVGKWRGARRRTMKKYYYFYMLTALWYGLIVAFLPQSEWYRLIVRHPWGYIVVNTITFVPVLVLFILVDKLPIYLPLRREMGREQQ
jgi:hypothetical protein